MRITASSVHVPGFDPAQLFGEAASEPSVDPDDAATLLGRRGLLGTEPATRLALCSVHRALGGPPRASAKVAPNPRVSVVVASNLGNVATVRRIIDDVRRDGRKGLSALDLPNASSNVIASTIAIWFRFGGPNFTVTSGAKAGLDAVRVASILLGALRADRVVVVGVEPGDEVASELNASRGPAPLRAAAACVVLERDDGTVRGGPIVTELGAERPVIPNEGTLFLGRSTAAPPTGRAIDLEDLIGTTYGGQGVLFLAIAAHALASATPPSLVVIESGDPVDGFGFCLIRSRSTRGSS